MQLTNLITLAFAASAFARNTPRQTEQFHYKRCGGFVVDPQTCDEGFQCLQPDPRRPGVTDLPGICVPNEPGTCVVGTVPDECPSTNFSASCYDLPLDGCDPENGDVDCPGICLEDLPA